MNATNNIVVKPDRQKEKENKLVFSYMALRNLIGFLGMMLPLILIFATRASEMSVVIEPSISDYYYTNSGDLLVVTLCILGVFLFTYRGYDLMENILSSIAAIAATGVAFSPTATKIPGATFSVHTLKFEVPEIFGIEIHAIFAALFFISLSIISLIYFPQTDADPATGIKGTKKANRNVIYRTCGWIMLICVVIMAVYFISVRFKSLTGNFPFIFTMETIAVEAFALSWLTKGETFYPDGEHYVVTGYKKVFKY